MATLAIVINFNIFEHRVAHLLTSVQAFTVDVFRFQAVKEPFSRTTKYGEWPGDRINDHHLTLAEKRSARETVK